MTRFSATKLPDNMRSKVMVATDQAEHNGSPCWEWTGAINSRGYGSVTNGKGKSMLSHRRAYMELMGPIPQGLTIDHLCFNKLCVNTDHMEVVTRSENSRRKNLMQTHCKSGHPLSGENLRLRKRSNGFTYRLCITCQRRYKREFMRKIRARGLVA